MGLFRALKSHTNGEGRTRRVGLPSLLLVAVVPIALAACGSSSANGSSSSTTEPSGAASATAYTNCLKQHGATLPNFTPGAGGETPPSFTPGSGNFTPGSAGGGFRSNPTFQKAAAACKSLRPAGGFGFGRGSGSGGFNSAAFAAYRNCLKLHGLTLPTGSVPKSGAGSSPPTTFDQSSPAVQAALQACAALRPSTSSSPTTAPG